MIPVLQLIATHLCSTRAEGMTIIQLYEHTEVSHTYNMIYDTENIPFSRCCANSWTIIECDLDAIDCKLFEIFSNEIRRRSLRKNN